MTLMPLNPELEQARHDALVALGGRVRELRLAKSMTQQQLADATGMHSILTSTEGGNLQDRSLYARRNPMLSLTIGFSVARANIKVQESWRATLRSSGGNTPSEPRAHLKDLPNRGHTVA